MELTYNCHFSALPAILSCCCFSDLPLKVCTRKFNRPEQRGKRHATLVNEHICCSSFSIGIKISGLLSWVIDGWKGHMGDDIGSGLWSMAVCFDFYSTNVVQLSNRNPFFYRFWGHHPLITRLILHPLGILTFGKNISNFELNIRKCILVFINFWRLLLDLQACLLKNQLC